MHKLDAVQSTIFYCAAAGWPGVGLLLGAYFLWRGALRRAAVCLALAAVSAALPLLSSL